jgi:hypothetical protein
MLNEKANCLLLNPEFRYYLSNGAIALITTLLIGAGVFKRGAREKPEGLINSSYLSLEISLLKNVIWIRSELSGLSSCPRVPPNDSLEELPVGFARWQFTEL